MGVYRVTCFSLCTSTNSPHVPCLTLHASLCRYDRGQRSLLDNLRKAGVATTGATDTTATARALNKTIASGSSSGGGGGAGPATAPIGAAADDDDDVPVELDDIVDILLTGLRDAATVVRWSSAKGVGRVCGRLPSDYADEVSLTSIYM